MTNSAERRPRALDAESRRWRVLAGRFVLLAGAALEILFVAALPFDAWQSAERSSLLMLTGLVLMSIGIAFSLNRFPRPAVGALGALTVLSVWQLLRVAHIALAPGHTTTSLGSPPVAATFMLASLVYYSFPIALIVVSPIWKSD